VTLRALLLALRPTRRYVRAQRRRIKGHDLRHTVSTDRRQKQPVPEVSPLSLTRLRRGVLSENWGYASEGLGSAYWRAREWIISARSWGTRPRRDALAELGGREDDCVQSLSPGGGRVGEAGVVARRSTQRSGARPTLPTRS
jgi:hypothetical protein